VRSWKICNSFLHCEYDNTGLIQLPLENNLIFFLKCVFYSVSEAGHRGLTARALVAKVDKVEVAPAATKSQENLSTTAGVLENRSRENHVLIGSAQVHSPTEDHYTSGLLFKNIT